MDGDWVTIDGAVHRKGGESQSDYTLRVLRKLESNFEQAREEANQFREKLAQEDPGSSEIEVDTTIQGGKAVETSKLIGQIVASLTNSGFFPFSPDDGPLARVLLGITEMAEGILERDEVIVATAIRVHKLESDLLGAGEQILTLRGLREELRKELEEKRVAISSLSKRPPLD